MATLALDHTPGGSTPDAADLPTPEALLHVAMAFLDAGLVEASSRLLSIAGGQGADPELTEAGRQRAVQIMATDAAVVERTSDGSAIMLPSAEYGEDGSPRFFLPLQLDLAGQPEVMQVITAELNGDGVDAELRNFLGAFAEDGDMFVDCDPGFGFACLSAGTIADRSVNVVARAADADHAIFLRHAFETNDINPAHVEGPSGGRPQSLGSLLSRRDVAHASRIVIHGGTADDLAAMHADLHVALLDRRCAAVAWTIGSTDATRELADTLEARGGTHFVVASDEAGLLLVPKGQVEGSSLIVTIPAHALEGRQAA